MRLLDKESRNMTKFIQTFPDGSGVYARPLSVTERDTIRRKANAMPAGTPRSDEYRDRRYCIGILKAAISEWKGFTDLDDKDIPYSPDRIDEFYEMNPTLMNILFQMVHTEVMYTTDEELKNFVSGPNNLLPTE